MKIGWIILIVIAVLLIANFIHALLFKPKKKDTDLKPLEKEDVDAKRACDHLSEAISYKTISHTNPDDNDWDEFDKFHKFLEKAYPLIHKNMTKEVVSRGSLIYHWKGKNPDLEPMALISHMDVVPVTEGTEDDWEHPAFSGYNDGEFIWGRGALDMKNHLICSMEAVETLMEQGFVPDRDVYFCFGHDEEVNDNDMAGAIDMVELLYERGIKLDSVIDEGGAFLTLDFKGLIEGKFASAIGIAEKGYSDYRITLNAKGGHSSQPPKHSALGEMANVIRDLENHQFKATVMPFMMNILVNIGKMVKFPLKLVLCNIRAMKPIILAVGKRIPPVACLLRTTTAVTMAKGSPASNVLPQTASITVNFRQMPGTSVKDVEKHIRKVVKNKNIDVEVLGYKEVSAMSPTDSVAYKTIEDICKRTDPENSFVVPYVVMGSTDAYYYGKICDNVLRFSPFRVSVDLLTRTHATNECCPVSAVEEAVSFFMKYVRTVSKEER